MRAEDVKEYTSLDALKESIDKIKSDEFKHFHNAVVVPQTQGIAREFHSELEALKNKYKTRISKTQTAM